MCQNIYLSSLRRLPEISWNENSPGFYLKKVTRADLIESLKEIMKGEFFYEALSFMGCSCGLSYADWLNDDNPDLRRNDVNKFAEYLDNHKRDNHIVVFSTDWTEFQDEYSKKDFRISEINEKEFYIEELVLYTVI